MDIVKFCKEEHNIKLGCHTLQLGTFDYYRNLDPEFSIADAKEGSINYLCINNDHLVINSKQFNAITGGGIKLTDQDSPNPLESVDSVRIKMVGGEFVGQQDGTVKIKPGKVEAEVFYPNSYIFCCSLLEKGIEPDAKSVSDDYNSYYRISSSNLQEFANTTSRLIAQNLLIGDLKLENKRVLNSHVLTLGQAPNVRCIHDPVEYIDDKEYRFVFLIEHPVLRFLPVVSKPKILEVNPIATMLG